MYTGLFVLGGLVVVGIVALIVFKTRAGKAANTLARGRSDKIEEERVEEVARTEARVGREKIGDKSREEAAKAEGRGGAEKTEEEKPADTGDGSTNAS
jgi:hypothetical protein